MAKKVVETVVETAEQMDVTERKRVAVKAMGTGVEIVDIDGSSFIINFELLPSDRAKDLIVIGIRSVVGTRGTATVEETVNAIVNREQSLLGRAPTNKKQFTRGDQISILAAVIAEVQPEADAVKMRQTLEEMPARGLTALSRSPEIKDRYEEVYQERFGAAPKAGKSALDRLLATTAEEDPATLEADPEVSSEAA